jgi:hypothetical protein
MAADNPVRVVQKNTLQVKPVNTEAQQLQQQLADASQLATLSRATALLRTHQLVCRPDLLCSPDKGSSARTSSSQNNMTYSCQLRLHCCQPVLLSGCTAACCPSGY